MRSPFIVEHPHVQVDLGHPDRMRLRAVKVEAFVGVPVALIAVRHVVAVDVLNVDPVPTCRELDVDFKLCEKMLKVGKQETSISPLQASTGRKPCSA